MSKERIGLTIAGGIDTIEAEDIPQYLKEITADIGSQLEYSQEIKVPKGISVEEFLEEANNAGDGKVTYFDTGDGNIKAIKATKL